MIHLSLTHSERLFSLPPGVLFSIFWPTTTLIVIVIMLMNAVVAVASKAVVPLGSSLQLKATEQYGKIQKRA
jgi:hypothetical protein